jgi:hypothetical protein
MQGMDTHTNTLPESTATPPTVSTGNPDSAADLHWRQQRLREVAVKWRTIFTLLEDIEKNYPEWWEWTQKSLREELDPAMRMPDDIDLETWAQQQGDGTIEPLLKELENLG